MNIKNNLISTDFIDSDNSAIIRFANETVGSEQDQTQKAIKLYYAVRDGIRYDPYRIQLTPNGLRASTTLNQGYGYCVAKAVLLAAVGRAVGIATRVGFSDVRNHLSSEKLKQVMQSDVFAWHGYTEFYLDNKWVKATPAFNQLLCDKAGIKPLDFDGINDSIFHEFDQAGDKHMEYLNEHGHFDDVPFQAIVEAYKEHYPLLSELINQQSSMSIEGDFEEEATTSAN
jgi:transglutaminase-like putative cysteine protease